MNNDIELKNLLGDVIGIAISIVVLNICLRNMVYGIFQLALNISN